MLDEFLTVMEIAEQSKINPQTIRNWINQGDLPAVRLGARRVRVRRTDWEQFVESSTARVAGESTVVGDNLDETAVAAWTEFGIALADAAAALGDEDRQKLAEVLGALSDSARELSAQLQRAGANEASG